jgi:rhodanese-related sulfurtransferase
MQQFSQFVADNLWLFLALLAILGLIIYTEIKRMTRAYREVPPSEAVRLMNREDAVLVDIREPGETGKALIAGAKQIPLSSFKPRLKELEKYRDRAIIAYCARGQRSSAACDLLVKNAFGKVYHLKGGMAAWESEGLPTTKP